VLRRPDPAVFDLPVDAMRSGRYSDKYFLRTRQVLINDGHRPLVVMQVFSKASAWLCGIDEAIAVLKLASHDWSALEVHALYDGDAVSPNETVMTIKGPYDVFAELETIYLGILARRTRIHTQTRRVVEAANGKDVLYFPARHDHWSIQEGDGYAAYLAGASGVSTDAQGAWWEAEGVGTIPHALIATYGGDTVLAARKFVEHVRESMNLVVLVDFDNDCVKTSLDVAEALGHRLYGVRLDTPESLVDASLAGGGDADHLWEIGRAHV
jgi:nicotinate phosphoribosyltransferase